MSEYIACLSDPARPGRVQMITSRDDPRLERGEGFATLRAMGWPTVEWVLPVVDRALTMNALTTALTHVHQGDAFFSCHPMDVRSEAIRLTTVRTGPQPTGLLTRLGLRKKAA